MEIIGSKPIEFIYIKITKPDGNICMYTISPFGFMRSALKNQIDLIIL